MLSNPVGYRDFAFIRRDGSRHSLSHYLSCFAYSSLSLPTVLTFFYIKPARYALYEQIMRATGWRELKNSSIA